MAVYGKTADGKILKTQYDTILYYLMSNPGMRISSWVAIKEFGFTRLAAIVKSIEYKTGIKLKREMQKTINRYGAPVEFMEYWYEDNNKV